MRFAGHRSNGGAMRGDNEEGNPVQASSLAGEFLLLAAWWQSKQWKCNNGAISERTGERAVGKLLSPVPSDYGAGRQVLAQGASWFLILLAALRSGRRR